MNSVGFKAIPLFRNYYSNKHFTIKKTPTLTKLTLHQSQTPNSTITHIFCED